ncbi:AAA family ATPase [Brevibacillus brevis]|uniref:AAA family ATPase n=1 Tax=Brevibacillus brevis TaxID=1393 RepID=UPI0007D8A304|nr:AAA family ATPase [Brevibacillus brevis]WGV57553.1 AAA family ATPase [Brevibacillus brevis]
MLQDFIEEVGYLIRARYSILYIFTQEEERALEVFQSIGAQLNKRMIVWTATKGLILDGDELDARSTDFRVALEMAEDLAKEPTLFVWCDLHPFIRGSSSPIYIRKFREFAQKIRMGSPSNSVIISPSIEIPIELQKEITILDLPLPELEEVKQIIVNFTDAYKGRPGIMIDQSPEVIEALARAAVGLTRSEIENCLAKALVKNKGISDSDVSTILEEKKQIIRKSGILEYISTESLSLDQIGGLDNLKRWLLKRKASYSTEAREFGIQWPKGVLLVGVPGCGKSLCAKSVAAAWQMPLLRLDLGRVFAGIVGSSEANIRSALAMCEAVSPSIVWIDEIEKALSGIGSGMSDGGVATRIFGTLLTWMQEKKSPVFVFATANKIEQLPAELLRKGRFDEIFFVDLPTPEERAEIIKIHLDRLKRHHTVFDIPKLVEASGEGYWGEGIRLTGAEIEYSIHEGLMDAFSKRVSEGDHERDIVTDDILQAMRRTVPLAKSRRLEVEQLRTWAKEYAIRASLINEAIPGFTREEAVGRNIDF